MSIDVSGDRYFTQYSRKGNKDEVISDVNIVGSEDDQLKKKKSKDAIKCLCLYYCKKCMPFRAKPNIWETSQNDIFELNDVEDTGYPLILRLLENKAFDALFITTSLLSVYLYFFSEGFLMESVTMWAIIHLVNIFYTLGVIVHWLKIFIRSKRAKTNQGYTRWDVIFTFCTILPTDIIAMIFYSLKSQSSADSETSDMIVTLCRIHYIFRIRNVLKYLQSWEDRLLIGDFQMFFIRIVMWISLIVHFYACIYHRVACDSLSPKHFKMTVQEATQDICAPNSWMGTILSDVNSPLLRNNFNVLLLHYAISVYRAVDVALLLGYGDVKINLQSEWELAFSALTEITAWIFTLVFVSGTLTSLFIEKDTEREEFMTRQFAISRYLDFNPVGKKIKQEVVEFYNYLWGRSRGVVQLDLIEILPISIRAEVFYNINKFVLDKLPLLSGLDDSFLMNLSMHMEHTVHLPGEILFRRDEIGTQMFYIIKGYLDVLNEDETQVLTNIRSGSVLGEIFLIHSYLQVATVRCATECVMMELTKDDFNEVLEDYPDYHDEFQKRIEHRFAQSSLLLSLCEKQNQFTVHHTSNTSDRVQMINAEVFGPQQTFDNVANVLNFHRDTVISEKSDNDGDLDGLKLKAEAIAKLQAEVARRKSEEDDYDEGATASTGQMVSIFKALESDVARAASLASDLGISLAPMIIAAPEDSSEKKRHKQVDTTRPMFAECVSLLRERHKSHYFKIWKLAVCISACAVLWFYPYHFAYRKPSTVYIDYIFHIFDIVFAVDYVIDMVQIVVTPKRSIENLKEIILFRAKSAGFYIRFISFIPFEYVIPPIVGWKAGVDPYYYAFKLNRLISYPLITKFVNEAELKSRLPMISTYIVRCAFNLYFLIHICAVSYAFLLRDVVPNPIVKRMAPPNVLYYNYSFTLYWATQITTSTGFGDIPYSHNSEVFLMSFSLIWGTFFLIQMVAKMASILANSERRRVSFKRTFFQVQSFMDQRKMSPELKARVSKYYKMLWITNEGVLIPSQDSPIWDTPKHLHEKVSVAQAFKYISRIPLTKYLAESVQNQICKVLRQYCVPPGETVLYPGDRSRELFIINKGVVEIRHKDVVLGTLGVGRYFGMPGLIHGKNKNDVHIKTITHCQLFCLHHDDLMAVLAKNLRFELEYKFLRMGKNQSLKLQEFEDSQAAKMQSKKNLNANSSAKKLQQKENISAEPQEINYNEIPSYDFKEMIAQAKIAESKKKREQLSSTSMIHKKSTIRKGSLLSKPISPHGSFLKWWSVIRVLAAVVLTAFAPAQATFTFDPLFCLYFMLFWDIIAWIDLLVMMRVGFYGAKNQAITDGIETFKHYLKGSFIIDVLACFPFEYIIFIMHPSIKPFTISHNYQGKYYLVAYLRLNRVFQVYRLVVAGRVLEKAIFRSLSFLILVEVIPMLIIFINGMACFATYLVCDPPVEGKPMNCSKTAWLTHGNLFKYQELNKFIKNPEEYFIVGIYWVTTTIMAVGYGDLDLKDDFNRNIAIFVIICGLISAGFLASKLTACMAGEDPRKLEIREKAQIVFSFLEQYRTTRSVRSRVREHYFSAWDKTKGISVEDLFSALYPTLKTDVMKELYEPFLRKSPVFANLDEPGIRMLSLSLKEVYFPEGEFIMKYGDLNDDVFLICSGVVVGYTAQGKIIGYMGTGSLIGEISVLYDVQRLYTAVTATGAELFVFGRDEFVAFLRVYPDVHLALEKACLIHYRQTILETTGDEGEWDDKPEDLDNYGFALDNEVLQHSSMNEPSNPSAIVEKKVPRLSVPVEKGSRFVNDEVAVASTDDSMTKGKEIPQEDNADEKPIVIEDPIRISPVKKENFDNTNADDAVNLAANNHWYSWLLTFGKKIPRDEMGFIHVIQEKKKLNPFTFVVHPSSNVCNCVSLYLCLTAISCGLTAYEIAFGVGKETEASSIGGATTVILAIRIILEIFFILRIVGNFHLGYYSDKGVLMQTIKMTTIRYMSRFDGFFIDLMSTLPFYLLAGNERQASNIRCLQLLRMILFVRYLNESATDLRMKASNVKIFKVTVLLCFVFHFCACSWYLVSCYEDDCNPRSWVSVLTKDVLDDQTLVENYNIKIGNRYLLALNYVANTITYSGLSDMTARLTMELIMTIMIIFATVLIVGQLLGEMTQCLSSQVSSKIHFQYKLSFLENHLNTLGLKAEKINEVIHYFKLLWSTSKSMQYHTIMQELPYPLRADIYFEIYGPPIKKSRILRKLDDEVIRQICVKVRHEMYVAGARIMRVGNVVNTMYIVTKGEVVVLDEDKNTDICVTKLVEGNCFGEVKMFLPDAKYAYSYTARLETEIGVISREDLFEILQKYPMLKEELQTLAQNIILQRQARVEEEKQRFQNIRASLVSTNVTNEETEKAPNQTNRFLRNSPSLQDINISDRLASMSSFGISDVESTRHMPLP